MNPYFQNVCVPKQKKKNWEQQKYKRNIFKTYNKTIVSQLSICSVKINHRNKQRLYRFFVVHGNGQALLGMPDIETL